MKNRNLSSDFGNAAAWCETSKGAHQLSLAVAINARKTDNFALANFKFNAVKTRAGKAIQR